MIDPTRATASSLLARMNDGSVSAEDIARAFHGHPTLNEAVKEAALAIDDRAIHI